MFRTPVARLVKKSIPSNFIPFHLRTASIGAALLGNQTTCKITPYNHHHQCLNFSALPNIKQTDTHKLEPAVVELQRALWDQYLANGRGCEKLFRSLDICKNGTVSAKDVASFILTATNYEQRGKVSGVIRKIPFEKLQQAANDHHLNFPEFQSWLMDVTKVSTQTKGVIQDRYQLLPYLGGRSVDDRAFGRKYSWNETTMNQSLRRMQYAVRGEVVMKAESMLAEGRDIIFTNIGNPHSVGQNPISFYRQVLALCDLPADIGLNHPNVQEMFPKDVIDRAKSYRSAIGAAGTGAYTNSQGIYQFRADIANFIQNRDDGIPSYPGDIFITNGASSGIQSILTSLIANDCDAIMIPIPQYPVYSALITLLGGRQVGYELEEETGWGVTEAELERCLKKAISIDGLDIKAMAIINPGNPTGQVLTRDDLEIICKFCSKHGIVLLADEVYQRNVYTSAKSFISAKKVAVELENECSNLQLISFHSTSKGLIGECGRRGGYMELHGIDPYVASQLYKLASSGLCSNVGGQIMTSLMLTPPREGDDSYELFMKEESYIMNGLKRKAKILVDGLNKIEGIDCEEAEGAMYAFPKITNFPKKAIEKAKENGQTPDTLYALSLLEETGICVVPASGFGQKCGRIGFRTTFLPKEERIEKAIDLFGTHHEMFCKKYS
mmetsp:Transcript_24633/g.30276  ORF Transcript_24633/g.30276 Transcript_24633/m.30276 type:complete len:668 (+) Transcript_24633:203-2206(+)